MSNFLESSLAGIACGLGLLLATSTAAAQVATTENDTFVPSELTVPVGTTVTWTIGSDHDVVQTLGDNCVPRSGGFISGEVGEVDSFSHTFNEPGTYYYMCSPHCDDGMKGRIIVEPDDDPGGTGGQSGTGGESGSGGDSAAGGSSSSGGTSATGGGDDGSGGNSGSNEGSGGHAHSNTGGGDGSGGADGAGGRDSSGGSEGLGGEDGTDGDSSDGGTSQGGGGCSFHGPATPLSSLLLGSLAALGLGLWRRGGLWRRRA